jgi:hypothetical protein
VSVNILQSAVLLIAFVTMGFYIQRLVKLSLWHNSVWVVLLHFGLASAVAWAAYKAANDILEYGDVVGLLAAVCWIVISRETWIKGKPPEHFTKPMELDDHELPHVHGGKQ